MEALVLLGCLVVWRVAGGAPVAASAGDLARAVDYMTRFGYLAAPRPGDTGENLRAESHLREAIRSMQRFGNLSQTGIMDGPTLALMTKKRCGVPDMAPGERRVRRYALQGQTWNKTAITWGVEKWATGADPRVIRDQLARAFRVWSDVSKLTFHEVRSSGADITVSFLVGRHGDGYPFDGKGAVLAHAFFPGEGIGGDAHFDGAEMWTSAHADPDEEGVNLFAVAAHEFGHSLGLSHSSVPGSLMFPYYQGIGENFQLPFDDRVGIQQIYGAKNPVRWGPMVTRPPQAPTQPPARATRLPEPTRRPPPHRPPAKDKPPPDTCTTTFDAISVIRREVFIFKDRWFWRLTENGLMKGYPVDIDRFWYNLPASLERIDAVYERPIDTKIVFFSGQRFWVYNANRPERGYPQPLTALGLPADLKRLDAALVWGHNGKTYFFSGRRYWRYDEAAGRVEPDYPRDMVMWRGTPYQLDAAFQWTDGKTYFIKGHKFWKFNDLKMQVDSKVAGDINQKWLGCPARDKKQVDDTSPEPRTQPSTAAQGASCCCLLAMLALLPLLRQL